MKLEIVNYLHLEHFNWEPSKVCLPLLVSSIKQKTFIMGHEMALQLCHL